MDWTPAGLLAADAVAQQLGVELDATDPLTLGLAIEDRHTNFLGVTHGGITYTLVKDTTKRPVVERTDSSGGTW